MFFPLFHNTLKHKQSLVMPSHTSWLAAARDAAARSEVAESSCIRYALQRYRNPPQTDPEPRTSPASSTLSCQGIAFRAWRSGPAFYISPLGTVRAFFVAFCSPGQSIEFANGGKDLNNDNASVTSEDLDIHQNAHHYYCETPVGPSPRANNIDEVTF